MYTAIKQLKDCHLRKSKKMELNFFGETIYSNERAGKELSENNKETEAPR